MKMDDNMLHEWRDYRRLVLQKLEELDNDQKLHAEQNKKDFASVNKELLKIEVQLENQKTKVGFIGAAFGIIGSGLTALVVKIFSS